MTGTLSKPAVKIAIVCNVIMFFVYGFLGGAFENFCYVSVNGNKTINSVVLTGFPLYSIGGMSFVAINRALKPWIGKNVVLQFLAYGSFATLLEYITGVVVGAGPGARMANGCVSTWDYSHLPFNYKGIISLKHFILWGLFGFGSVAIYNALYPILETGVSAVIKKHGTPQEEFEKETVEEIQGYNY